MGARKDKDIEYLKKAYEAHKGEWLTREIVEKYQKLANELPKENPQYLGARKALCQKLMEECDVTEVEAYNIVNGHSAMDYVRKYERIRLQIPLIIEEDEESKLELARNLLGVIADELIAEKVGLSVEQVKELYTIG